MDIVSKAKELGDLIALSKEMGELKRAEQLLEADGRAKGLLEDYNALQMEMVKAVREGRDSTAIREAQKRLFDKREEIDGYEITAGYLKAKTEFDGLMKTVNDVLVFTVTGEEPCSPNRCGSCGGCARA